MQKLRFFQKKLFKNHGGFIMIFRKSGVFFMLAYLFFMAAIPGILRGDENILLSGMECPKKISVLVETVKTGVFMDYQYFSGQGKAEIVAVTSPVAGVLSEVRVSEGSLVDVNQELVLLNAGISEEIKKLAADVIKAKKILAARQGWKVRDEKAEQAATRDYQKALDLLNEKKAQADMVIKAPVAGIVHLVLAAKSELAAGTLLLEISDPKQIVFQIPLADGDKGMLTIGDKFSGKGEGLPKEVEAEVVALGDAQATFRVDNNENQAKEGVYYIFKKLTGEHTDVVVIPSQAVQKDSLGDFVYVVEKKKAKKLYVTIGAGGEGRTMIEKGLAVGSELIVSGFDCISDGKSIRVVNQEELAKERAEARARLKAEQEKPVAQPEIKVVAPPIEEKPSVAVESRFRAGLTLGRFPVNDENYRLVYPNWFRNIPGIEISVQAMPKTDVYASAKLYVDKEQTSYFGYPIKFQIIPLSLGLRYRILKWKFVEPFVGAGLNLYLYTETISGETDLANTSDSAMGFYFFAGSYFDIIPLKKSSIFLLGEFFVKYNIIKKTLAEALPDGTDTFDLGGIEMGIGLGVRF
jgi:membrane fusion protein (multidrug efflux system)